MPSDCPICLEEFKDGEELFSLPCHSCEFNFCSRCVETFVRSSQDDYQIASDGSRQVKVHIACPQCRSKYPMDIREVLLLRQAYILGTTIFDKEGKQHDDSELSATQLSLKRDFFNSAKKRQVLNAYGLYLQVMDGQISTDLVENAEALWNRLFQGVPDLEEMPSEDGSENLVAAASSESKSPRNRVPILDVDISLFQGLEDCIGSQDEKVFLTQLLTSGDISKLAQAAM